MQNKPSSTSTTMSLPEQSKETALPESSTASKPVGWSAAFSAKAVLFAVLLVVIVIVAIAVPIGLNSSSSSQASVTDGSLSETEETKPVEEVDTPKTPDQTVPKDEASDQPAEDASEKVDVEPDKGGESDSDGGSGTEQDSEDVDQPSDDARAEIEDLIEDVVVPFDEVVELFDPEVAIQGYSTKEDLELDLQGVFASYVNGGVLRITGEQNYGEVSSSGDGIILENEISSDFGGTAERTPVGDNLNDFETNNQEEGVREGDKVVTNGKIAFATYQDFLLGWNVTSGERLIEYRMEPDPSTASPPPPPPSFEVPGVEQVRPIAQIVAPALDFWIPTPFIESLVLYNNYLVAAVSNYGYAAQNSERRALSEFDGTRIFVFDILSLESADEEGELELDLIAQRDINGRFVSLRVIDENLHVVTSTSINAYPFLIEPLERWNNEDLYDLDTSEYVEAAKQISNETIPMFVDQLVKELTICGQLPNIVRLNKWISSESVGSERLDHFIYPQGVANSFVGVASFSLTEIAANENIDCYDVSGSFFPAHTYDINVYSAEQMMVVAARGSDWSPTRNAMIDSTYVVTFKLDGATSAPHAINNVEGTTLDQYSFRVDDDVLELATTIRQLWFWRLPSIDLGGSRKLQIVPEIAETSTTENYITTFRLDGNVGTMEMLDSLQLGKVDEVFTTVRFYDGLAYAVTFERVDPFYVLDTSDPRSLKISGSLDNITGWSDYLEPINDEKTVMLAIGQETDEFGRVLGVQISVFDARDTSNVTLSARFLIESDFNVWSSSEGLRDKNAIRFNQDTGLLIMPISMWSRGSYRRGMAVFHVSIDEIVPDEACSIDFSPGQFPREPCYYCAELAPRAMIIEGSLMATTRHYVVKRDLDTCEDDWRLQFTIVDESRGCCSA